MALSVAANTTPRPLPVGLMESVGDAPPKRKRSANGVYDRSVTEVAGWLAGSEGQETWGRAEARHFVALYAVLHERVYGAAPAELRSEAWWGAVSAAGKMLREEFGGEPARMLDFVRWTWRREQGREKKRGDEQEVRRVGWKLQFLTRHLLTDYRVANAQARKPVNR